MNRRVKILLVIFFSMLTFSPHRVFGYDTNVAHPGIIHQAVLLYNKNNNQKISVQELGWLKQGVADEDNPTRWLNHFYDPIYNKGLTLGKQNISAKIWTQDPASQTTFSLGDNSWQRALDDYKKGDKERAFKELGHVLHLMGDMTVPAHTRDSVHAVPPDSYEEYVKNNWGTVSKNLHPQYIAKNNPNDVFDDLANFSNNNFYSDNTIESEKYNILDIHLDITNFDNKNYYVYKTKDNRNLYVDNNIVSWQDILNTEKNNQKDLSLKKEVVLYNYSSFLLPRAIGYSAGVIKLFFDEAQKNDEKEIAKNLPKNRLSFSRVGDYLLGSVISAAESIYNGVRSKSTGEPALGQDIAPIMVQNPLIIVAERPKPSSTMNVLAPAKTAIAPLISPVQNLLPDVPAKISDPIVQPKISPVVLPAPTYYIGGGGSSGGNSSNNSVVLSAPVSFLTPTTTPTSTIPLDLIATSTPTSTIPIEPTPTTTPTSTPEISTTTPEISTTTTTVVVSTTPSTTTSTTDTATTTTTSTPEVLPDLPLPAVIINEVAWAGTASIRSDDEYIELYNNTDQDIVLFSTTNTASRWQMYIGNKKLNIAKVNNATVLAHGFYLLERGDDYTVADITADAIYTGALNNTGEKLTLTNASSTVIDEVDCSAGWFAGSGGAGKKYMSMERVDPAKSGNDAANWQTNQGPHILGTVDGGGDSDVILYGSPKQPNLGPLVIKGTQADAVVNIVKSDYPYILHYYEIPAGKTLNIDAGAVIKSSFIITPRSGLYIYIKGNLNINGTNEDKVVMTSDRDVSFFNSNFNQISKSSNSGSPQPKDWQGLQFFAGAVGNISGLDLRYAGNVFVPPGATGYTPPVSQAIRGDDATVDISDSTIASSGLTPLFFVNCSSTVVNVVTST